MGLDFQEDAATGAVATARAPDRRDGCLNDHTSLTEDVAPATVWLRLVAPAEGSIWTGSDSQHGRQTDPDAAVILRPSR